jgi:hypothetical protein
MNVWSDEYDVDRVLQRLLASRDVIGFAMAQALVTIEDDLNEDGWDIPPSLMSFRREMYPPELLEKFGADGFMLGIKNLGEIWGDGATIAAKLRAMASALAGRRPELEEEFPDQEGIFGWAVTNEGWTLVPDEQGHVPDYEGSLAAHPDRVEIRFILAVDQAGVMYQLSRRRDNDVRTLLIDDGKSDGQMGGVITEGLIALAEATR